MPYITQSSRQFLDPSIRILIDKCRHPGDVTYCIYKIVINYLAKSNTSYSRLALCLGILESAKQEFYRRLVAPYEDKKCGENGDVNIG